jgi:tetratricopeptide (TPR) repeat protein
MMLSRITIRCVVTAVLTLWATAPITAQQDRLGTLSFPTSGTPAAQPDFIRGVLLLHSFEYDDARGAFRAAQAKDSGFAMAYWGDALTWTHGLWNEQNLDSARAALARLAPTPAARAAKAATARERAWLGTVEALYGDGPKARRDTLYARALEQLVRDHPDDEARLFHALAIMSESQAVRNVPAYMRGGAMALDVFARQPDHPGAAHYVIHAFDDPVHAPLGLPAARAYSRIAPGADHAQHMTTHIFLALGMWQETVAQNVAASGPDSAKWQPGHYTYWMHYGLLQQGRYDEAAKLLDRLHAQIPASASLGRRAYLGNTRAQHVLNAERWNDPSLAWPLRLDDAGSVPQAVAAFTVGYAALQRGDRAAAQRALASIDAVRGKPAGPLGGLPEMPAVLADELRAALLRAEGKKADAERLLRAAGESAAKLPAEYGPPDLVKPPQELLGEWLLADGNAPAAQQAFARALELWPGRLRSLQGLSAAAAKAGDTAVADAARAQLPPGTAGGR